MLGVVGGAAALAPAFSRGKRPTAGNWWLGAVCGAAMGVGLFILCIPPVGLVFGVVLTILAVRANRRVSVDADPAPAS